jgi:uncharacterized small protein (DUF1192 family)
MMDFELEKVKEQFSMLLNSTTACKQVVDEEEERIKIIQEEMDVMKAEMESKLTHQPRLFWMM